jgi:hypothetical protein
MTTEQPWTAPAVTRIDEPFVAGERETAWSDLDPARAEENYAALLAEWEICDEVLARHDLGDLFETPRDGTMSCRWVVVHLIEEYVRHNGHADLLREHIDGVTGS